MNIFSGFRGLFGKARNYIVNIGTELFQLGAVNGVTGDPAKIATVYTCCRVLSDNLSRMPLSVFITDSTGTREMTRHRLTYLLKFRPNNYQNAQQFFSTLEYHRNEHGNAFARITKDKSTAYPVSFDIIHPLNLTGAFFSKGELYYNIVNEETGAEETINAWDILHFRGLSNDGIFGLSTLNAIKHQTNINERAASTIDNFYKNNATSPVALETELPGNISGPGAELLKTSRDEFTKTHVGPENAGKWINVPIGTKIKPIPMQFADAQLIETLRFTREDIAAAYGLPLFMVDGSAERLDVEQLTTLFKNNTMGPVTAIYMAEINGKLLTRDELATGFSVMFDVMALIGMDYQTKVTAIKDQVVNGLMTPNEGARRLGNLPIDSEFGNLHYTQAQYIPLERRDQYDVLLTTDPAGNQTKSKNKNTK